MANSIRIARSTSTNTPASLDQGELAYSEDGSPNTEGELFIGTAGATVTKITTTVLTGTDGVAAQPNASAQDNQTITTGLGIDGADAGDSGNITISLGTTELATATAVTADQMVFNDATDETPKKQALSAIGLSLFNDDLGHVENATHTGDVTGDVALTIAADAVTYAKMQNVVAADVFLGNTGIAGSIVAELTGTQATEMLDLFATASTVQGLVPGSNSLGATYFLDGSGAWSVPAGGGDVVGPGPTVTDNAMVRFDGTGGLTIQETGIIIADTTNNVTGMGTLNTKTIANLVSTTDTGSATWTWFIDDDTMATASATTLASSESVKAYVDTAVTSGVTYQGAFDPTAGAGAGSPDLDTITSTTGDMYTVTVAGTYNWTTGSAILEIGDVLIAESDGVLNDVADWTIVQQNLSAATTTTPGYVSIVGQSFGGTKTFEDISGDDATATIDSFVIDGGTF